MHREERPIPKPLVVFGAGGFGREALDVVTAVNDDSPADQFTIVGVIDDAPSPENLARLAARGVPFLGSSDSSLATLKGVTFLVGIGAPGARRRVADMLVGAGLTPVTVVHPSAVIGTQAQLGRGVIICAGVSISTNVHIGDHVHVNASATIGHDTRIEDFVSVNPAAVLSGDVIVRRGSLIGASATVLQGLEIGAGALVGASACVTRSVAPGATVMGVPAR